MTDNWTPSVYGHGITLKRDTDYDIYRLPDGFEFKVENKGSFTQQAVLIRKMCLEHGIDIDDD